MADTGRRLRCEGSCCMESCLALTKGALTDSDRRSHLMLPHFHTNHRQQALRRYVSLLWPASSHVSFRQTSCSMCNRQLVAHLRPNEEKVRMLLDFVLVWTEIRTCWLLGVLVLQPIDCGRISLHHASMQV